MSEYFDAVIFIDRRQAKLFHFSATDDVKLVFMHTSAKRRHHRADHEDATKHGEDDEFLHRVVGSLDHAGHTLITGPGNSKFELQAYMRRHRPDLAARISGVETLDDAEDSGILALAHQFCPDCDARAGTIAREIFGEPAMPMGAARITRQFHQARPG